MSAGFKRKPNDLALLLSFGETCALTILIAENEACHFRRSVPWESHSKNNVSCIQGLQAEVEGAGAVRSEGSRSGEDGDELRAEASPEVASQLQLIVPKQECRLLWPDLPMFQREGKKLGFYVESPVLKYYPGLQNF